MTEIQDEGLTTDLIETADVQTTGLDTEQVETTDEPTLPDSIDTGIDGEDDEEDHPSNFADVRKLIQDGDAETALQRLSEMDKGIEKLKARTENVRNEVLSELSGFYDQIAAGDPEAIEALDQQVFGKKGTSLKAVFAASIGLDADDLDVLLDGGEVTRKEAPKTNKELEALKAEVNAIKQEKLDAEWSNQYGSAIQKYLRDATGIDVPVDVLAKARHLFPKKASVSDIEEAVMQVNPRAYRTALASKGAKTTPASATVSRGGKGSSLPSAEELLSDPRKFEAYIAAQRR
jgi:hypothetical protein